MLHALDRRKARLRDFRGSTARLPVEDVMTSTILGPLEFLTPACRATALNTLFVELGIDIECDWNSAKLDLWPRRRVGSQLRSNYVEPDALILDARGTAAIIEVKWGAPLSPFELAAQWDSLDAVDAARAVHLLLVREPLTYGSAITADRHELSRLGHGTWRLKVASWLEFARALDSVARQTQGSEIAAWASVAARVIRREDFGTMEGFSTLQLTTVSPVEWRFSTGWFQNSHDLQSGVSWWRND